MFVPLDYNNSGSSRKDSTKSYTNLNTIQYDNVGSDSVYAKDFTASRISFQNLKVDLPGKYKPIEVNFSNDDPNTILNTLKKLNKAKKSSIEALVYYFKDSNGDEIKGSFYFNFGNNYIVHFVPNVFGSGLRDEILRLVLFFIPKKSLKNVFFRVYNEHTRFVQNIELTEFTYKNVGEDHLKGTIKNIKGMRGGGLSGGSAPLRIRSRPRIWWDDSDSDSDNERIRRRLYRTLTFDDGDVTYDEYGRVGPFNVRFRTPLVRRSPSPTPKVTPDFGRRSPSPPPGTTTPFTPGPGYPIYD